MNFYHAANASRAVKLPGSNKRVTFDVYHYFAGAWLGIAATDDPETIEGLDELTFKAKSGITRITEEEYKDHLKKKASPPSYRPLTVSLSPPQAAIQVVSPAGRPAVVVEGNKQSPVEEPTTPRVYDSLDDVLQTGEVKPMDMGPERPKREEGQRSARSAGANPSRRPRYRSDDTEEENAA